MSKVTTNFIGLLLVLLAPHQAARGQIPSSTICYGPASAKVGITYLHGIDDQEPSDQELTARKELLQAALANGWRIAVPRSSWVCPSRPGKICWPYRAPEERKRSLEWVKNQSQTCLENTKERVLYGFSNGGYFAAKLFTECETHGFDRIVISGASGDAPQKKPAESSSCGRLDVLIGTEDISLKKAQSFVKAMEKIGYSVKLTVFQGGHRVEPHALKSVLAK